MVLVLVPAACVAIPMQLLGSMDSCAAGSAFAAMQRKLASLSTADHNQFQERIFLHVIQWRILLFYANKLKVDSSVFLSLFCSTAIYNFISSWHLVVFCLRML